MSNKNPFFSIGICSFKRPQYLTESINSVLSNSYQNFEIIISDDCSPNLEEIKEVLKPFENHKQIKIFYQNSNLGWSDNRNFIKSKANGDYLIIIGDDDLFFSNTLETLHKEISKNSNKDLYLFGFELIDEVGKKINSFFSPQYFSFNYKKYDIVKRILKADHFPFWFFHPLTLCMDVRKMRDVSFNKEAGIGDDYLFLYDALFQKKDFVIIPKKLFKWRKIQVKSKETFTNISASRMNNIIARRNILKIIRSYNINDKFLYSYIQKQDFENEFLLKSMVTADINPKDILDTDKELYKKYIDYRKGKLKIIILLRRIIDYIFFTKLKGLFTITKFTLERIKYKINF